MTQSDKCEPNLTPLLDVVLQLIMFFILCSNFIMEQVNESIKLPEAISAKALDQSVRDYTILNVDAAGVTTVGLETYPNPLQVQLMLRNQREAEQRRDESLAADKRKPAVVILRASKDCTFKVVHDVMQACRRAGYSNVQLRAVRANDPSGG